MATQLAEQADEPPVVEIEQDNDGGEQTGGERDYEAEARERGWRPLEEFKGDPDHFTDAKTFVERGEKIAPLMQAENRALKREMAVLKKDIARNAEHLSKYEERAYNRALADLKARQIEAVQVGDVEAHEAVGKEIDALRDELAGAKPDDGPAVAPAEVAEALIEFRADNPWYDERGVMADYADMISAKHANEAKNMAPAEFFAMIAEKTMARFPNGKAERKKPLSAVEAPGGRAPRGGRTFSDLPPEAQKMCDRWVASGLLKSRDDYVKSYDFGSK